MEWKFLYRSIKNRLQNSKREGMIGLVISMFFLLMVLVLAIYLVYLLSIVQIGATVEDALVASELSGALIDIERFGKTGEIMIEDTDRSYAFFYESLKNNLCLDVNGNSSMEELNCGPVSILDFRVYNVSGEEVFEIVYDGKGRKIGENTGRLGEMKTPDNKEIVSSTIYGKIGFYVKGMNSTVIYGEKEKTVDIARCVEEESE